MNNKPATQQAIALKYEPGNDPEVVAKGFGDLAEEIIKLAEQSGVMVHQDEALSSSLAQLDLGQHIPPELYYVIAELIAFSYVLQGKTPDNWQAPPGQLSITG